MSEGSRSIGDSRESLPAPIRALLSSHANTSTLFNDLAPQILQHRILHSAHPSRLAITSQPSALTQALASLGRSRLLLPSARSRSASAKTALDLTILEQVDELLALPIPSGAGYNQQLAIQAAPTHGAVSLLAGFQATTPSASKARQARRRRRAHIARGGHPGEEEDFVMVSPEARRHSMGPGSMPGTPNKTPQRSKPRRSLADIGHESFLHETEADLEADVKEIEQDRANIEVRRKLVMQEIEDVDAKIAALERIRSDLKKSLLTLREEELELADEIEGVNERLETLQVRASKELNNNGRRMSFSTSRRRKGPAFLPSEHDSLPSNVAFMTLHGHIAPISALDFSEPYGLLVSAAASPDDSVRLWDLTSGEQRGFLKGHDGMVKCLQVESAVCVTGGADGRLKVWDLEIAEAQMEEALAMSAAASQAGDLADDDIPRVSEDASCILSLDAHTKDVTCLYFDGTCLVTGSSDKTLKQWDMNTGQSVITMDILWAISNPSTSSGIQASPPPSPSASRIFPAASPSKRPSLGRAIRRLSSQNYMLSQTDPFLDEATGGSDFDPVRDSLESGANFAVATPAYSDGSWDMYQDFVGGVQFWGYALASGSADGCVRMWDMRTGQNHRTLIGHTLPVTCLQFDETHLISGSLDKSIRIWDLRTGKVQDTIRFDGPITALQFDSRKIVVAAGENAVRTYNRTTLQHDSLTLNGHTKPVERLRFMDKYLTSGGRDNAIKVWSLA